MRRVLLPAAIVLACVFAGPAAAQSGAVLHVDTTAEVREGQRVTVSGSGFRPGLAAVAVGVCKQGYTNGLHDCDLGGGATFVNISGDGTFAALTLTLHPRFDDIDCTRRQCVIAAAPLPGTEPAAVIAANSAVTPLNFAGSQLAPVTAIPAAATADPNTDTRGPSTVLWSVTAALLAVVAAIALADRRRL